MATTEKPTERYPIDTNWFLEQLRRVKLSYRQLALRHLHIDPASVSLMMRGRREMRMQEAATIAAVIGQPVTEVMRRAGIRPLESTARLVGEVDGDGRVTLDWDAELGRVPRPPDVPTDTVALACRTGMGPLQMLDGAALYVRRPPLGDHEPIIDRLCVVQVAGEPQPLFRYVRRGYRPGTHNLHMVKLPNLDNAVLEWATPILWTAMA